MMASGICNPLVRDTDL
uniref:Uncharacterized protein n=1 Tax=Anguilla anguilla TaxID=7936 RepID=A0A0E9QYX7_ANGAN